MNDLGMVYLDNNATTRPDPAVAEIMLPFLTDLFGNPSSPHAAASEPKRAVGQARQKVAGLIGAKPPEIVFTGSATEANHMAILGALKDRFRKSGRRKLVTTPLEHPSTLELAEQLVCMGFVLVQVPAGPDGRVSPDALAAVIDTDTALVSVMWVNNETGVIQPVAEAAEMARLHGALFHTDAVQAAGKLAIDVSALPVDLLTLSAHKLHGPKGIGALYVRKGVELVPLLFGSQERKRRGGTENVPAIAGFGKAAELATDRLAGMSAVGHMRDRLEQGLMALLPASTINGGNVPRTPNCCNICLRDSNGRPLEAEALLTWLDRAGICVSMGSACSSGEMAPSGVLMAMGASREEALGSLRLSLSHENSAAEIEHLLAVMKDLIPKLAA